MMISKELVLEANKTHPAESRKSPVDMAGVIRLFIG